MIGPYSYLFEFALIVRSWRKWNGILVVENRLHAQPHTFSAISLSVFSVNK